MEPPYNNGTPKSSKLLLINVSQPSNHEPFLPWVQGGGPKRDMFIDVYKQYTIDSI